MKGTTDTIRHMGTIMAIDGNVLHVKMLQSSACAGCHAAKLCQSSETKEKEVDVRTADASCYEVGQKVMLLGSVRQGLKATVWAYMIPVVVLVVVLLGCTRYGASEVTAALVSMGAVALYFFGLYLFRDRFADKFSFEIEKRNNNNN